MYKVSIMIIHKELYLKLINELSLKASEKGNFFTNLQKNFSLKISRDVSTYIFPVNFSIKRKIDNFLNDNLKHFINNLNKIIYEKTLIKIPDEIITKIIRDNKLNNYKIFDLYNSIYYLKNSIDKIQESLELYIKKPLGFDLAHLGVPNIKFYIMIIFDLLILLYYDEFYNDKFKKTNLVYFFWSKVFIFMIIDLSLLKDGVVDNSISAFYHNHKNEIPFDNFPTIYNSLPPLIVHNTFRRIVDKLSARQKNDEIELLKKMYPKISDNYYQLNDNIEKYRRVKVFNIIFFNNKSNKFYNMENWKNTINNIIKNYSSKHNESYKYCPIFSFLPKDIKNELDGIMSKRMYINEIIYLLNVFKFFTIYAEFNDKVINNFIKNYYSLLNTIDTNGEKMHAICKSCRDFGRELFEYKMGNNWILNNDKETYYLLFDEIKSFIEKWQKDAFNLNEKKRITVCFKNFNKYGGLVNFLQFPNMNKLISNNIDFPLGYICGRKSGASGKRRLAK